MIKTVDRIHDKLAQVRSRQLRTFGSERHGFDLNPPLTEAEVHAFERIHGILLPEDYRIFLLHVGNGGAGPYYGLLPLGRWNAALLKDLHGYLSRPSPLRPDMPADEPWEQSLGCEREQLLQGMLALCHQGSTFYAMLVITGDHRGRVVYIDQHCSKPPYFVRHTDFLSWYERWLDELLWGYESSWFGIGLPGTEQEVAEALRQPDVPTDVVVDALATLLRIPSLEMDTLNAVQDLLLHAAAEVRGLAIRLLTKHSSLQTVFTPNGGDGESLVRPGLAPHTVVEPGWAHAARTSLADTNRAMVFQAMCSLQDAGLLDAHDIHVLLRSTDPAIRLDGLWAAQSLGADRKRVPIPDELFQDPAREVRRMAILTVGGLQDHSKVPLLLHLLTTETELELLSSVAGALGNMGDRRAVAPLMELTRHADGFVRQDAARALGRIGDPAAIPALQALLQDHSHPMRVDTEGLTKATASRSVAQVAQMALDQIVKPGQGVDPALYATPESEVTRD